MGSVSFPKGYLLSSTPVQSSEDSGYFGSSQRRSKTNALSSCSPIKESSFKNISEISPFQSEFCKISPQLLKFEKNLHINSIKKESLSGSEINELSEFTSSSFSDQNDLFITHCSITRAKQKLRSIHYVSNNAENTGVDFNSLSRDRDIKYKLFEYEPSDLISSTDDFEYSRNLSSPRGKYMRSLTFKKTKIDFIHELEIRNCLSIISHMLHYLSAKELSIASCVSKTWKKVVLNDYMANLRRKNFITERILFLNGPSKENRLGMRCGPANEHKTAFSDLTNIINTAAYLPTSSRVSSTTFDSFIKEAKNGQKLLKCPRCCYASKYSDSISCVCTHCFYRFCGHCLDPILKSHTCFKPQLPNIVVGSRRSKKNLRRL